MDAPVQNTGTGHYIQWYENRYTKFKRDNINNVKQ